MSHLVARGDGPIRLPKKGKFNDISAFRVRKQAPEFKKPLPLDPILKDLAFYKEECPAIQESDEAGYLVSIDVLTEAKILRKQLEERTPAELAARELVELLEPEGPEWPQKDLIEFYLQCVTSYSFRRVSEDRSDEMKYLLEGMQVVPPQLQVPVLQILFGEEVVNNQLAKFDPAFASGSSSSSAAGPSRAGAGGMRAPGGARTTLPRPDTSASWHGSESTAVEETEEERAKRQAKNKKKNAQKRRKAAAEKEG